jgi:hypothetical protein
MSERTRPELVGWVVLSRTRVELNAEQLRAALDELYPGSFLPPRERGSQVTESVPGAEFLIQSLVPRGSGIFLLHSVTGRYAALSPFADYIDDPALRALAEAQTAWLSLVLAHGSGRDADGYRFIGNVLARLAPPDAAALVHPSRLITMRFDARVRARLASGETLRL